MSEYVIHVEDAKTLYGNTDFPFPLNAYLREKVTRCRDCKWFTPEHFYEEECEYGVKEILSDPPDCGNPKRCHTTYDSLTGKMVPVHIVTEPDGYCAWADRRESC